MSELTPTTKPKTDVVKRNPVWVTKKVSELLRLTGFATTKGGKFDKTKGVKKVEAVHWTWLMKLTMMMTMTKITKITMGMGGVSFRSQLS